MLVKKAFFDVVEAVKACQAIPEDDMLRIIRGMLPEPLLPSYSFAAKLDLLDKAQLAVSLSFMFHAGYSVSLEDGGATPPRNLHVEYVNEQAARNAATKSNGTAVTTNG